MIGFRRSYFSTDVKFRLAHWAAAIVVLSSPAGAADWSLKFGASQSLSVNDNIDLTEIARDTALQSTSTFNFDLLGKAKTYEIELAPSMGVKKTFFSESPNKWSYQPAARFDFRTIGKVTNLDAFASFARTDASSSQLLQDIITTNEGDELTYAAGVIATHKVNGQNTLEWSNIVHLVDYTIPSADLVPNVDFNSNVTWRRQLTQLVGADFSSGIEYYDPDSQKISKAWGYRSSVGANARLTKRLSVKGNAGVVLWDPVDSKPIIGPTFAISADYQLKDTSYGVSAVLDLSPGTDGKLTNTLTTNFNVAHQINDLLTIGLSGGYSMDWESGSGTSSALIITPSVNYQVSRDWKSSVSYQFVKSDDPGTSAYSNAVFLTLNYGTVLIP